MGNNTYISSPSSRRAAWCQEVGGGGCLKGARGDYGWVGEWWEVEEMGKEVRWWMIGGWRFEGGVAGCEWLEGCVIGFHGEY